MVVGFLLNLKFGLVVAAGVAVVVAALLASDGLHRPQETPGANWRTSDFREPHDPWTRDRPNRSRSSSNSVRRRRRQAGEDSQKTIMTDELCAGIADCSICVERIERYDEVYSCKSCYNIFHLRCIRKWANTCLADHGRQWSCPVCKLGNNVQPQLLVYTCMCGQTVRPTPSSGTTPHCCTKNCPKCRSPCHPGACD